MSQYLILKDAIDAAIYENSQQAITGSTLNTVLNSMVTTLGENYQFGGLVSPTDTYTVSDSKVVFLASEEGDYPAFGNLSVENGEMALIYWDTHWYKKTIPTIFAAEISALATLVSGKADTSDVYTKLQQDATDAAIMALFPAQTFTAAALTNPYTSGLTPRRIGDIAVNSTSLEVWVSNALTAAVDSWHIDGLIATVERLPLTQAIAQLKEDLAGMRNLVQANIHDLNKIPVVMGVPLILYGAGVPSSALIPDNWPSSLPWDGIPFFKGQQYINTSATSGGLYYAKGNDAVSDWINA